ncbi:uncharacterized protein [Acropora muricata]|uniref:uncharacterized protein n=1 Tax=Acropora muricata TaxID=159855 RepID=UPI0034E445CF
MNFTTALVHLLGLFQVEAQPVIGLVRFRMSLIILLASLHQTADNGRLDFTCHPETNNVLTQECLSRYSAEMRSFIHPYFLVRITAGALFALWSAVSFYSSKNVPKIRKNAIYSEKEHLCHEFWGKFLLHVCCEAVVIAALLVLFCYTQKMYFSEDSYNCTLRNASVEIVVTCRDIHHWEKAHLNIFIIGGMAFILLLCISTICYAIFRKKEFIKDLVDLTKGNEEGGEKRKRWTHEENVVVMECYYKSKRSGDKGYMKRMHELWIGKGMFDIAKKRLAGQARSILKKNLLGKNELKGIRERVGFQGEERERQGH